MSYSIFFTKIFFDLKVKCEYSFYILSGVCLHLCTNDCKTHFLWKNYGEYFNWTQAL